MVWLIVDYKCATSGVGSAARDTLTLERPLTSHVVFQSACLEIPAGAGQTSLPEEVERLALSRRLCAGRLASIKC